MFIGHVCLSKDFGLTAKQLLLLVDAIGHQGIQQSVVVRCPSLAHRLANCTNVTVAGLADSPVIAYSMVPPVDLAHMHDPDGVHAGLLLALTRSTPYIITCRSSAALEESVIVRAAYRRAACIVCTTPTTADVLQAFCPGSSIDIIRDAGDPQRQNRDANEGARQMAAAYRALYCRSLKDRTLPAMLI